MIEAIGAAPALARAQTLEHELGDRAQRLEHAGAVQRVGRELRHAAEIERVRQLRGAVGSARAADPACCTA